MGTSRKNVDPETLLAGKVDWGPPTWGPRLIMQTIATIILSLLALIPIMAANTNWTRLEADWTLVRSWAEEKGVTTFAAVGEF